MKHIPKSGRHNILKSPENFLLYGEVNRKVAEALHDPEVVDFFATCIQRVMPKSKVQVTTHALHFPHFFSHYFKLTCCLLIHQIPFDPGFEFSFQAEAEVNVVRAFFENFSGDNVRMLMRGFVQAGDHTGQRSIGYR